MPLCLCVFWFSAQAGAPHDLFENRLIDRKFVFRGNEHHIKQALIVEAGDDPHDFGGIRRVRFTDHYRAQSRLVTDKRLYLRAG